MSEREDQYSGEVAGEQVEDADLLRLAVDDALLDLHTGLPARVEAYDKDKGTVAVTLMINRLVPDGDGGYVAEEHPQLAGIPVKFPRTKKFEITFPLEKGDQGYVAVAELNLGRWRATGNQADPGDVRRFSLDGAVFMPGLYDDNNAPKNADSNNMVIGSTQDGDSRIEIKPTGGMNLGAGATEKVLTMKDFQSFLKAFAGATIVAQDGGASLQSTTLSALALADPGNWIPGATIATLGSNKVKAKR